FASASGKVLLTAYLTPKTLPQNLAAVPDKVKKVAEELKKESKGKFDYAIVSPRYADKPTSEQERAAAETQARDILKRHGVQPRAELLADKVFYYAMVLEVGGKVVPVPLPPDEPGEAAIKSAITDALKRGSPGFRKGVGLWTPPSLGHTQGMIPEMGPQQLPPPQQFQILQRELSESYEVRPVKLDARVPDNIDVLVLGGPAELDEKAVENVDQFVMRGGALVVFNGRFRPS